MTDWVLEGAIPKSAIVVILDDGDEVDPQTAIRAGADVIIFLHSADPATLSGAPFMVEVVWRAGLVPGRTAPGPFWIRWAGSGFERVEEFAA